MQHRLFALVAMMLIDGLCACSPVAGQNVTQVGVFAESSSQLIEVPFGTQADAESLSGLRLTFRFDAPPPISPRVKGFLVNIPDAIVSESKLYLLRTLAAVWTTASPSAPWKGPDALEARTEVIRPGLYRITPRQPLQDEDGYLALSIRMPLGVSDRLYAVRLSNRKSSKSSIPLPTRAGGHFFSDDFLAEKSDLESETPQYILRFSKSTGQFDCGILADPVDASLLALQKRLREMTGLTSGDLCALRIKVFVPRMVDGDPRDVALPGCPK